MACFGCGAELVPVVFDSVESVPDDDRPYCFGHPADGREQEGIWYFWCGTLQQEMEM